jgi:uncharacterized protein with HEPN domain
MSRATVKRLHDAHKAAEDIIAFTTPVTWPMYQGDYMLQLAVERLITILGEAMSVALRLDKELALRIPDARLSIDIRNRIIHGYDSVDHEIVWSAATVSVPLLFAQITRVLDEESSL